MLREVQRVYRLQGVEINDKHIEVIVRQMLKKIRVDEAGDSGILPGINMDVLEFNAMNEKLIEEGKEPATGKQIMLGITKASLATLKENVLIGKLIPAGTGMKRYRNVKLDTEDTPFTEADFQTEEPSMEFSEEVMGVFAEQPAPEAEEPENLSSADTEE